MINISTLKVYLGGVNLKNNIKIYRTMKELKQEDLAEILGITLGTYSLKESGKSKFTLLEAKMLSDFFGVTIEELFFMNLVNFKHT